MRHVRQAALTLLATIFTTASCVELTAAEAQRRFHTKNGSDVELYADGSARLVNERWRWNLSGRWRREGSKYCVDWIDRASPKQCYW